MAVNEHDDRRCRSHAIRLDDSSRALIVALDLDDLDPASVIARDSVKLRLELTARGATVREELDEYGASVVEDFVLEGGVVCLVDHLGTLGYSNPRVHSVRSERCGHVIGRDD